ncbi:MAG: hypothetical protein JSW58_06490 [Candidatus Latescibacterota bacterium]|nr:MAG: hypothetical protein JSW58_06490 [Candidatus Latescibacterota bacterium]
MKKFKAYLISIMVLVVFSVGWRVPWTITSPGLTEPINMTLQDTLLLVSDPSTGIHIYDIGNPLTPEFVMNIPLRGNRGTAIRDDIVYANVYGSLLVIRLKGNSYEVIKTINEVEPIYDCVVMDDRGGMWGCACSRQSEYSPASPSSGVGSSYATFAVIGSFLYYLDYSSIVTMDISTPEDPTEVSRTRVDWSVETLFPTEDYLFVGGTRGMYIYDRSNPKFPVEIGRVEHFEGCDPVVVSGTVAFVTLRGGNACGETRDVLLSVNIEDPHDPVVIGEKPIKTPYGLTVDDVLLYVGKGRSGFELFNVAAPGNPSSIGAWSDWAAKDFIWRDGLLIAMGFRDVRLYDVSTPAEPILLSHID